MLKIFFNFFRFQLSKSHLPFPIWCGNTIFNVCGSDIRICDDELAEALKHLSERNRENLLMYYFLEMSDTEIAKRQNISRSGVFQNRHNSLELIKKILKEK